MYSPGRHNQFEFAAIINTDKYNSFPASQISELDLLTDNNFNISDVKIKMPDNPSVLKNAKLITLQR